MAGLLSFLPCCMSRERDDDGTQPKMGTVRSGHTFRVMKNKSGASMLDQYELDEKVIGEGGFGTVRKGWLKDAKSIIRAIKEVKKVDVKHDALVHQEIKVLETLDHPCICRLLETFEDDKSFFLVLEFIDGRELFDEIEDAINKHQRYSQDRAAQIMRQVFGALSYCHANSVLHRDLKPENIMVLRKLDQTPRDTGPPIKVIDFGLAAVMTGSKVKSKLIVGTMQYLAPEASRGDFRAVSDVFSVGVILHVSMAACFPAKSGHLPKRIAGLSEEGMDLLRKLLQKDPSKRLTAAEAYKHPWTNYARNAGGNGRAPDGSPTVQEIAEMGQCFVNFRKSSKLKQAALAAMATQISGQTVASLLTQFNEVDKDGSGFIDKAEFAEAFIKNTPPGIEDPKAWAEELFDSVDQDGSGEIEFSEFEACMLERLAARSDEAIRAAFRVFDRDRKGVISAQDVSAVMGTNTDEDGAAALMIPFDENGDGVLDFAEFKAMLLAQGKETPCPATVEPKADELLQADTPKANGK